MLDILPALSFVLGHRYTFYSVYYPLLGTFSLMVLLLLVMVALATVRISQTPKDIAWAGLPNSNFLPKLRASILGMLAGRKPIHEGYEKFSKHNKPFIVPALHWNTVILPPTETAWVASQPETVLSGNTVLDETMGLDYLAHGPSAESVRDFSVIRRDLTRQTANLAKDVYEEIRLTIDDELGFDEEWKEVRAMDLMKTIAFRAANRVFVGAPLCRDKGYRKRIERWSAAYGVCTIVMMLAIPRPLKKYFMAIVALPVRLLRWLATRELREEIAQRLNKNKNPLLATEQQQQQQEEEEDKIQKNDMMQWILSTAASKPNPLELNPSNIAGKMILFNLFATGTTSTMTTLILQDLLHHPSAISLLELLHQEAQTHLPRLTQSNDPLALRSMVQLDSLIRESLRLNPLGASALLREVIAPNGLITPHSSTHLPKGTHIAVHITAHQRDEEIFGAGAADYRPLRFYNTNKEGEKQTPAVQLSEAYMSFGLGKHACPGRFWAVSTMKLILGYLVMKYEVQGAGEEGKEKMVWEIGEAVVPSDKWVLKVRRRKGKDM